MDAAVSAARTLRRHSTATATGSDALENPVFIQEALAVGAGAVGALAIARLHIQRATIQHLNIEELQVGHLRVRELEIVSEHRPG